MPRSGWQSGWVAGYVCVFTLITQTLCLPVEAGGTTDSHSQERTSLLSLGEQQYVSGRKERIKHSLQGLGLHIDTDSVPHIALLGSGGGQRASVALLGALHQMGLDHLLDPLLYMGGVSGSCWSMSSLYTDPQWSTNTAAALDRLTHQRPGVDDIMAWLKVRSEQPDFSLSDLWGSFLSSTINKQLDRTHLSDEAKRQTTNPYPVYSALELNCFRDGQTKGKWFELTPHESGFTELNNFVPISQLGKRQGGKGVNGVEVEDNKVEEVGGSGMDMISLQGILGSAMADEQIVLAHLPGWLRDAIGIALQNENNLLDIFLSSDEPGVRVLQFLERLLATPVEKTHGPHSDYILASNSAPPMGPVESQERKTKIDALLEKSLKPIREWALVLPDSPIKDLVQWVVFKLLPLITGWKWGTTANFLYHSTDMSIPECLRSKESLNLIDAGLYLMLPYAPFLGPRRDMDLIISLDFSMGQSLENLIQGRDYAAEVGKPFPVIDDNVLEDMAWPKDFYVFPGGWTAPTIVYMPLFNQRNCRDADEVNSKMAEYTTIQMPYNQKKTASLLKIAMDNLKHNKHKLMHEMYSAADRKHKRVIAES